MDQAKIGRFLSELRKEKKITQEQLAEKLGVARRTISRWETGSNLPDIDFLIELSDLYEVDLREILDGARKNEMLDQETKETVKCYPLQDENGTGANNTDFNLNRTQFLISKSCWEVKGNLFNPDNWKSFEYSEESSLK